MSITNSILVAVILMCIVFIVLAILSSLLKLQASILNSMNKTKNSRVNNVQIADSIDSNPKAADIAGGEMEIIGVDERTAAMIMAIAIDELKIPLNELRIKYIKALD